MKVSAVICALTVTAFVPWNALAQAAGADSQPAPVPAPVTGAVQDQANDLVVDAGKAVLVDTAQPVERIAIGSGDIAEATAVSPTEVMLNGKAVGETSLIVWQTGGGRQFFNVKVRPSSFATTDKLDSLRRELRLELPGQNVRVSGDNGTIFLRGTVKDLTSSDRAVQIASTAGKVVNLLYVDVPKEDPQILLKVRFASLDRTKSNQLGLNIFSLGAANSIGSVTTQQFSPPTVSLGNNGSTGSSVPSASLTNMLNLFIFRPDINLGATIQALEQKGVVQVLAEPNVLTMNGKQGSLLAGGQYPYPVEQGATNGAAGAITIQFKEFGVRLNFIPTITPRGTIRLQVVPEVSSLDFANGVTISGFTVPGIDIRRVKTEVELGQGQSFALGGLLDNRETETFSKIPFIGDVPVLGKFFQSVSRTKNNTELIVIVTPEIVDPIPAGAPLPAIKYPQGFLPPASGIAMSNPEGGATPAAPPATMPVEKLVESMKPEQPLVIDSTMGSSGMSTGGTSVSGGTP
ncbi:MAG TPA: pilus assembly protein N-terminal domain-containing protein [Acidobacteriaceae bacterium]|nr:pilus assembly protein N-terminal domain-containing protein [Acidobacteriaceae bacterium]